jgi:hypothetical protein
MLDCQPNPHGLPGGTKVKAKRARYQQGSIKKVPRSKGYAWEVGFSEKVEGKLP